MAEDGLGANTGTEENWGLVAAPKNALPADGEELCPSSDAENDAELEKTQLFVHESWLAEHIRLEREQASGGQQELKRNATTSSRPDSMQDTQEAEKVLLAANAKFSPFSPLGSKR